MRVLLVTNDRLGYQRAGPAIRCLELGKVLARNHEVTVASSIAGDLQVPELKLISNALAHPGSLRKAAREADIVVAQGLVLHVFPFLRRLCPHVVVDLYDPYLFEHLTQAKRRFGVWRYLRQWHLLNDQLRHGDFFICANERQWDYWLGRLCALGRLTPEEHRKDSGFRRLLDVVPFGIDPQNPQYTHAAMKGVMPGISKDDILLVWAGGIWQWFDPLTIIRAMGLIKRPDIKLVFLGTQHPNPDIKEMPIVSECRKLARELGVLGYNVFFREGWIPFDDRQNFLLEADIGVSAHTNTVETRLAFRTRILDYIWAGLPMILTQGDYFADWAVREAVGRAVAFGDTEGWKQAILSFADDETVRGGIQARLQELRHQFHWHTVAEPLVRYCNSPYSTRGLPRSGIVFSRLLTPAYRRLLHLKRASAEVVLTAQKDSSRAEFVDNGQQ